MTQITVGEKLKAIRNNLEHTQKEFSDLIGISQATLCQYEKGYQTPHMDVLVRIAEATNISMDWICGLAEEVMIRSEEKQFCIYKIFYQDELVYIGKTSQTLEKKLCSHFEKAPMVCALDEKKVSKVEYATLESEADALVYEIYYINKCKPRKNKQKKSKQMLTIEIPELQFLPYPTNYQIIGAELTCD